MPLPIPAVDLTTARASFESLMTESVTIKRPSVAKSATGGNKPTLSAGTASICRKRDLPSDEQQTENQLQPVQLTEFLMPHNADVQTKDVLVHSEGNFEVIDVDKRSTLLQLRVVAKKA